MSAFDLTARLPENWRDFLAGSLDRGSFAELEIFLAEEYRTETVFPPFDELFTAFRLTPPERTRVVILGQDPYHDEGQAHGLAFSVKETVRKLPPSLRNIFKELNADLALPMPKSGSLTAWARQGVLLLNTVLTVRAHQPGSHRKHGWETFTDSVISTLSSKSGHLVFVLWGAPAQTKLPLIDRTKHTVICSAHPSPLSAHRGFLGSRPFSAINRDLTEHGMKPIDWDLSEDEKPDGLLPGLFQ